MRSLSSNSFLLSILLFHSGNHVLGAPSPKSRAECAPAVRTFDYVIVGGGTAGLVLANRLTENADIDVAVIEAGTSPEDVAGNLTEVPGYAGELYGNAAQLDWGFSTTPQKSLLNRTLTYLRGKTLGGSGVLNFMNYGQTCKGAHQKWADVVDDQSYTYENMLQYYHKAMKYSPPKAGARSANATASLPAADAAINGTLPITFGAYVQSWSTWVALGLEAIGIPQVSAFVDGSNLGWAWNLYTIESPKATRSTSETAYLHPVLGRPNLAVFDYTFAQRIIFDDQKTATGVEVTSTTTNCSYTISADKEVILSAGVFQSPHLLQVSGVGPKAVLERYNISVVADRPGVGQNMQDQATTLVMYQVDLITNTRLSQDPNYAAAVLEEYKANRMGPLTAPGGDLFGLEKIPEEFRTGFSQDTKAYELPADWPEIAYAVYPGGATQPEAGANYAMMQAWSMVPRSVGSVTIQSADMAVAPVVDPNLFSSQTDVEVAIAGLKRIRQALNSSAMAPILIGDELLPGPDVQNDDELASFVAQSGSTIYHAAATNKMGKTSDPDAVVDNRGRVIGVQRLRVIDGSAFPFLPPGPSPYTQVFILAEKLANDIKNTIY
ncbi:glucose-methanol-choline oxidoreductase [Colletotrichum orchidophilum]|uniref:Glucose-methanol-choline oxidoreductase n=1 Tax=Colletotrichum orchidophilum TaxID=1209926 RepID=A0A1G4BT89_9PEZI|nr:glucose-methanol-choline oxidoreductase [Colletotrichum orchidophilum]OHF04555.1 glucose-methanol-choline oxidoreductase [Colletotrichum orchidophilum]